MEPISIANSKVHILFMVKNAPGVSYQMLMDKCMESLYMDFFNFSQAYNELIAGNLIDKRDSETGTGEVIGSSELLTITKGGDAILTDIENTINPQTRAYLEKASAELKESLAAVNSIKAFVVGTEVQLINTANSFELKFNCQSYEEAEAIADKWRKSGGKLSQTIINNLK